MKRRKSTTVDDGSIPAGPGAASVQRFLTRGVFGTVPHDAVKRRIAVSFEEQTRLNSRKVLSAPRQLLCKCVCHRTSSAQKWRWHKLAS